MPASEESEGGIGDDWGIGTIVWVRRRNGSWWPGRILGPEELTASHLMSPRSGTPVKLLGREDASVDWYNLEKSKRVKAFRCGEFNACIEKAEASQCVPIKKREKYARREDAILHALELEKQTSDIKAPKFVTSYSNKSSRSSRRDANIAFHSGRQLKYGESANHSRRVGSPSEGGIMSTQKRKGGTNGSGKNYLEATPRMRGLQDFGLQSAQASRSKDLEDTACRPLKKKRPQVGTDQDYVAKKRDRRRPLLKVLQSSAKIPTSQSLPSTSGIACTMQGENGQTGLVPPAKRDIGDYGLNPSHDFLEVTEHSSDHMQISPPLFRNRGSLVEENTSSGFNEANESSSTDNTSSDTDPETEEDETLCRAATKSVVSLSTNLEQYSDDVSFIDEDKYGILNESDDSSYIFQRYPRVQTADTTTNMGGSKWNMKGKQNFRNLLRNPVGDGNRRISTSYRSYETRKERQMKSYFNQQSFSYDDDYCPREDLDSCWTSNSNDRRTSPPKAYRYKGDGYNDSDEDLGMFPSGWEIEDQLAYWEAEGGYLDPFYSSQFGEIDYMWFDVDLKVEVRYKGQHVPLVSLMSKLNGQAIVGHPLQVETLTDGSTDSLVPKKDSNEDAMNADGNATPPPVWRTGRRTAMQRIPRPHHVQSLAPDGKEADSLPGLDVESNPAFKRSHAVNFDNGSRVIKTSHQNHKPAKFQKRTLKKPSLFNQKTRKLSSFAAKQRQTKSQIFDSNFTSVMKPELGAGPIVACVPVKVVFSRILEAVRRLPSTSTTKRGAL